MIECSNIIIDAESWRRALLDVKRQILDAEPMDALRRIDRLLDELEPNPYSNDGKED